VEGLYQGISFDLRLQSYGRSFHNIKARTVQTSQRAGSKASKRGIKSSLDATSESPLLLKLERNVIESWLIFERLPVGMMQETFTIWTRLVIGGGRCPKSA